MAYTFCLLTIVLTRNGCQGSVTEASNKATFSEEQAAESPSPRSLNALANWTDTSVDRTTVCDVDNATDTFKKRHVMVHALPDEHKLIIGNATPENIYTDIGSKALGTHHRHLMSTHVDLVANQNSFRDTRRNITDKVRTGRQRIETVDAVIGSTVAAVVVAALLIVVQFDAARRVQCAIECRTDVDPLDVPLTGQMSGNLRLYFMKKCAVKLFITGMKDDPDADAAAVNTLASVCRQWWHILSDTSNKQRIKQTFGGLCHPYRCHPKAIGTVKPSEIVSTLNIRFDNTLYAVYNTS